MSVFMDFLFPAVRLGLESLCPSSEIPDAAHEALGFSGIVMPYQPATAKRLDHTHPSPKPNFVVGQDCLGHWLAIETHGLGGGIFADRAAALRYAASESGARPDAVKIVGDLVRLAM
jgi:hypothetical protein